MKKYLLPTLIALSALSISAAAAFYSVTGLAKLFAGVETAVIWMASSLEVAKLVVASLLYQYWKKIGWALKIYLTIALITLMIITSAGIYDDIKNGIIHIIWTGGEPTIKGHQEAIVNFFRYWKSVDPSVKKVLSGGLIYTDAVTAYSEIETNGTIEITDTLRVYIDQINCSPKLSNSGMTEKQRIVPEAIKNIINSYRTYQFKFVISNEEDVQELFRDFVVPFSIPLKYFPGKWEFNVKR